VCRQTACASIVTLTSTSGRVVYVPCWNQSVKTWFLKKPQYTYLHPGATKESTSPNVPRVNVDIWVSLQPSPDEASAHTYHYYPVPLERIYPEIGVPVKVFPLRGWSLDFLIRHQPTHYE
jgi:hypothetical protein